MARKTRKPQLSRISVQYDVFVRLQAMAERQHMDIPEVIRHLVEMSAIQQGSGAAQPVTPPAAAVANEPPASAPAGEAKKPVVAASAPSPPPPAPLEAPPPFMEKGISGKAARPGRLSPVASPRPPSSVGPALVKPIRPPAWAAHKPEPIEVPQHLAQIKELEEKLRELSLLIETAPVEKRDELALTYAEVTAALADLRKIGR